ncbi:MAG: sulfite dehydrogenase [Vulcanimicrobiaceae bacterium]
MNQEEQNTKPKKIDRLGFLSKGATTIAGAALASAVPAVASGDANVFAPRSPGMDELGETVIAHPYGMPIKYEASVIRRNVPFLTATEESSVSFTPLQDLDGIITPNGLCFVRDHGGTPIIDPAEHRLMIDGLVERPLVFTMEELKRYPTESHIHFTECPANGGMEWRGAQLQSLQFTHGMIHCCEWTGVKLSVLMKEAGVKPQAKWMLAEGADAAAMTRSIPVWKALDDVLVVWSQNGERLRASNGYPVRLIVPGWQGNVNVKWLRRLKFGEEPWMTREETSKYTDLLADGKARQFAWIIETKSVITNPCPENPMKGKGFTEITGLAWSGRGKITRVDVSTDGGINWHPAKLQEPVLSKCLTRFRFPWEWHGADALLQSRAIDETGYVQPSIAQLRAVRGTNAIYNDNAIQTWHLNPDGKIDNVQVS